MLKVMETKPLKLMHVKSHLGDKWNDVAGVVTKTAATVSNGGFG